MLVTGSFIRRSEGFTAASPMTTMSNEDLQAEGTINMGQVVRNMTFNCGSAVTNTIQGTSSNTTAFNLRGLGSSATLQLMDGKRVPTDNVNVLMPGIAVERMEIVTDGAAAVSVRDAEPLRWMDRPDVVRAGLTSSGTSNPGNFQVPQRDENGMLTGESAFTPDPSCGTDRDDPAQLGANPFGFQSLGRCWMEFGDTRDFREQNTIAQYFTNATWGVSPDLSLSGQFLYSRQTADRRTSSPNPGDIVQDGHGRPCRSGAPMPDSVGEWVITWRQQPCGTLTMSRSMPVTSVSSASFRTVTTAVWTRTVPGRRWTGSTPTAVCSWPMAKRH